MNPIRACLDYLSPGGARGRLSIVIFHRVLQQPDDLFPEEMDAQRFDETCGWLANWFNVIPLDAAVDALDKGTLPPRALAITFDDGYADNASVALPILQRHGLPATFFVAAGFLDGGVMWNDVVTEALRNCPKDKVDLSRCSGLDLGVWPLASAQQRRSAIDSAIGRIKYLPGEHRLDVVAAVASACEVTVPRDLMMTSAQVRQLADSGMTIGGHTMTHPILARTDLQTARREVTEGRERLQAIAARPIELFAYPNGKPVEDYLPETVELVRSLGFKAAVSTRWGRSDPQTDRFQLPRFTPWDRREWAFALRMAANLRRLPNDLMEASA
jgi:peptidoglycan/xylan/chitin deacetylase (PgdA/CDA1 family)